MTVICRGHQTSRAHRSIISLTASPDCPRLVSTRPRTSWRCGWQCPECHADQVHPLGGASRHRLRRHHHRRHCRCRCCDAIAGSLNISVTSLHPPCVQGMDRCSCSPVGWKAGSMVQTRQSDCVCRVHPGCDTPPHVQQQRRAVGGGQRIDVAELHIPRLAHNDVHLFHPDPFPVAASCR
jgi:hypothetical protein